MSNLQLTRADEAVVITVASWAANTTFSMVFRAGSEWASRLLVRELDRVLTQRMQEIRRAAYEQGWKDRAAKRRKETWFSGELP